ncbi:MAG: quinol oxidase subunit 4 [Ichthyobacteriaceae bacterium]|nr:quinol oxidase subunit 4 [Ichthyobacteriaceae bacterium]
MKNILMIISVFIMLIGTTSCVTYNLNSRNYIVVKKRSKKTPPGHAKKINGSKSAKKYAPSQVKKTY